SILCWDIWFDSKIQIKENSEPRAGVYRCPACGGDTGDSPLALGVRDEHNTMYSFDDDICGHLFGMFKSVLQQRGLHED
ncbi:MAG: hypothetical protein AB7T27_11540, partial [Kiritimatiellia bacterium]